MTGTGDATVLLLAAGASSRMRGRDKLLEEVGGAPLLRVMAARCAKAGALRVVLPEGDGARSGALDGIDCERIRVAPGGDMSASLKAGVRGLRGAALIVLADMPDVTAHDMHLILALSAKAPDTILRGATKAGMPGHPVLLPVDILHEIQGIKGDRGGQDLLRRHAKRVHLVPLPGRNALTDLDTPEDWAEWRAKTV